MNDDLRYDRTLGALLGVALGDALGLPFEGLRQERTSGAPLARYSLFGRTGFVSDDTEQTALLAHAIAQHRCAQRSGPQHSDDEQVLRRFRRSMVGWFLRLPFGIGLGTLKACLRMCFGRRNSGVRSAGNGAAMRAGILGVHFAFEDEHRRHLGRKVARLTHTDARAIEGALFVAEVAAAATKEGPSACRSSLITQSAHVLDDPMVQRAVAEGLKAAERDLSFEDAAAALGNTGFIVHTLAICTFCFVRRAETPLEAIRSAIRIGGDTDSHAAIVGGWLGAMHGARALPADLVRSIQAGPFGGSHLRQLARALTNGTPPPTFSCSLALLRNLCLFPVIVVHGLRRFV